MWSAIMVFFAMISLFMALWILDGSTDNSFFGSAIVRSLMTSAFGLLVLMFIWAAVDIQFLGKDDNDEDTDTNFLSQRFRKTRTPTRTRKRPSPPRRYIKRKKE